VRGVGGRPDRAIARGTKLSSWEQIPSGGSAILSSEAVELLRAVRHDIDLVLAPEVSSAMAVMIARMASDVLTYLIGREEYMPEARATYIQRRRETLQTAIALADRLGIVFDDVRPAAPPAQGTSWGSTEEDRQAVDSALTSLMRPVITAAFNGTAEDQRAAHRLLNDVVETTESYFSRAREGASRERAADVEMHAARRAAVTPEALEAYWRERFSGHPQVTSLRELAGGFGKTTILFELNSWEKESSSLVMRRDVLGGATETSVVDEFPVLQTAFKYGLPVPEPILLEPDPSKLDRPFIIVRRVSGQPAGDFWKPSPACTRETGIDLAKALAKLHGINPTEFGSRGRAAQGNQVKIFMDGWRDVVQRTQREVDPVLESALAWLELNFPSLPERPSYVHGDPGFWNILIENGRVTGLLDWELSHLGDPAEDISYVRSSIEQFMPWEEFLGAYREGGGVEYDDKRGEFYTVWRDVRNSICSDCATKAFWSGRNPELRMAHCGIMSSKQVLLMGAQRIAKLGLRPWDKSAGHPDSRKSTL
jgi:aminoglycoside phosphotransferase (APT) family kinase protein